MTTQTDYIQVFRDMDKAQETADPTHLRLLLLDDFIEALSAQFPDELRLYVTEIPLNGPGFPYVDVNIASVSGDQNASVLVDLSSWRDMCDDIVAIFQQASVIGLLKAPEKTNAARPYFTMERAAASTRIDDCLTDIVYFSALERTP